MVSLNSLAKPIYLNHAFPLIISCTSFNLSKIIGNVSFSTSITRSERNAPPARGTNTLRIAKKNVVRDKGKPPAVGERKNYRKRIVLSNSNALSVNLPVLDLKMIQEIVGKPIIKEKNPKESKSQKLHDKIKIKKEDEAIDYDNDQSKLTVSGRKLTASVVGLSDETIDSLRASKAFKITQSWELFRQPGILIRDQSEIMNHRLLQAQEQKTTVRMVIDGAKGSGKSMMLLYSMATAFVHNWVVIHIPEGMPFKPYLA